VKRYVLDATALIAFFQDEPGAAKVQQLLTEARDTDRPLLLSVVNWGEVYYVAWQRTGETAARQRIEEIARLPIQVVDADMELTHLAASLKARHKLPYADAFAASLALHSKASLVTSDPDFKRLSRELDLLWAH